MDVDSLGYRTDLALLSLGGSEITDRGDHLVVRTAHNPTFWWGNFILVARDAWTPGDPQDAQRWTARFAEEFPDAEHLALGFDATTGSATDLRAYLDRGLRPEAATVMTAQAVHPPPRPCREATYRDLRSEEDWAASIELRVACEQDLDPVRYREFVTRKAATIRAVVDAGHGSWFGAFVDGALVAQLGLLRVDGGLARFQSVETHPAHRGRGLAGTLVHHASRYGFDVLGAQTLVMVADPTYLAIRVYRSVGFVDGQTQLQVERPLR